MRLNSGSPAVRKLVLSLVADGWDALSPATTRILMACYRTAGPNGLVRFREVAKAAGHASIGGNGTSGQESGIGYHFKRLFAAGLLERIKVGRGAKYTRYRITGSLTIYRRVKRPA